MNQPEKPAGIDFLDFVFTVAMSVGLLPEPLNREHLSGPLSQSWFKQGTWFAGAELVDLCTFFLGLLTLILSWFGYHASMRRRPLKYDTVWGMLRFVLDVGLVIFYAVIILQHRRLELVLFLLMVVYALYVVWDFFKILEYLGEDRGAGSWLQRYRRECVSAFVLVWFFLLWAISSKLSGPIAVGAAIFLTFFYRINKICPTWERLFGVRE